MKHRLKISVSDKTDHSGLVACKKVKMRERLFNKLFGPMQEVTVIIPGQTVNCIAISEVTEGGGYCE